LSNSANDALGSKQRARQRQKTEKIKIGENMRFERQKEERKKKGK